MRDRRHILYYVIIRTTLLLIIWFSGTSSTSTDLEDDRLLSGIPLTEKEYNMNLYGSASIAVANYGSGSKYFGCEGVLLTRTTMLVDAYYCIIYSGTSKPTTVSVGCRFFPTNPDFGGETLAVTKDPEQNTNSSTYIITFDEIPKKSHAVLPHLKDPSSTVPPPGTECIALGYSMKGKPLANSSLNYLSATVADYNTCNATWGPPSLYGGSDNAVFCAWVNSTTYQENICTYGDTSTVILCKQWYHKPGSWKEPSPLPSESGCLGQHCVTVANCIIHFILECLSLCHSEKILPPFCPQGDKWYAAGLLWDRQSYCGQTTPTLPALFNYVPWFAAAS